MSAQLNLYNPRYLKQRDPFGLGPVLAATLGFYLLLAIIAGWAWHDMSQREALAVAAEAQLKAARAQVAAQLQAATTIKPSAQLLAEAENVEELLRRRESILRLLEGGAIGTTAGFAEYFRALARQAPEGLWLTGFSVAAGGDIRIEGRTLQAAAVPEYIGRLGREKAFQGKSFAALTMLRPTAVESPAAVTPAAGTAGEPGPVALISALAGVAPALTSVMTSMPTSAPALSQSAASAVNARWIDFVLLPKAAAVTTEAKP
ncbi:MAG: PilN domain-containing protein [Sulfuritalea sp.]|nr:PilN domain-containing protein [Sulfuritalea sp.]